MKIIKKGMIGLIVVLIFLGIVLLIPYTRARVVMGGLTQIEKIKKHQKFDLDIPTAGMDWFPKMLWFDGSEEFNRLNNTSLSLTILYGYGDFNKGTSSIFDETSPYYSSFFGAYVIEDSSFPQTLDELALIPTYDYENLILRDLGDPNYKGAFSYEVESVQKNVKYMLSEGWERVDISIQTHGLWHQKKEFLSHYIQFGTPKKEARNGFESIDLKGRLYFKRMNSNCTVVMYVITPSLKLLEQTDKNLLSRARFKAYP